MWVKVVVAAFNQEKALVGAFSVITNLRMELFEALLLRLPAAHEHVQPLHLFTLYNSINYWLVNIAEHLGQMIAA